MKRIVIIGGGAAGFFCAANLEVEKGTQIIILEKSNKTLSKVKISGGGRCNVTHGCFDPKELISYYPRGRKELLGPFHSFQCGDTFEWFAQRNVELKIEDDGRAFPVTDSSQTIIDCLEKEVDKNQVQVVLHEHVTALEKQDAKWLITCQSENTFLADAVVMTAGSSPQTYALIESLGIEMVTQVPSLFTFNIQDKQLHELAGISVDWAFVKIKSLKIQSEGPLLITHWGLSGPVILRMSAYAARELNELGYQFKIEVNWKGGEEKSSVLDTLKWYKESNAKKNVANQNPFQFSARLWKYFLNKIEIAHLNWADISNKKMEDLAQLICGQEFEVNGKSTFKDEFVTAGGVKLSEIDFKTMESKKHPGLYFAGEVLDIDAVTGGFNFQAAWTTAMIAANSISKTLEDKKSY